MAPLLRADGDVLVLSEHFRDHDGVGIADPLREHGYDMVEIPFVRLSFDPIPRVDTPGEGWWTLAVAARVPVLDHAALPIGRVTADPAGARAALRVGLDVEGSRLDLVAVHTSSKLWWANSVRHLLALARHLPGLSDGPAVVAGDCNLWGPLVERLLPGWRRAVRGRTYPAHRPHSQIDHVLVNDHVEVRSGSVLAAAGSDHRPIRAVIAPGVASLSPSPRA